MEDQEVQHSGGTFPKPHSILTNSALWQSERWNHATTKLNVPETLWGSMRLAVLLVMRRRKFDAIYTVGIRPAQAYGLLCRVFGDGNRPHVAAEIFLDEPRAGDLRWRIKQKIRRFALARVSRMIVFSSAEGDLYSRELMLPREKFEFVPFHTNVQEPKLIPPGSYGFAAGRSLRDWKTFFAAIEGVDCEFVVVADAESMAGLSKPANVRLYCDIPRSEYVELLKGAWFAVVPLQASGRSAGQVVILEAGSFGKPVIASDVGGVRDYITPGVNGLLVAPRNVEDLRAAIADLMRNEDLSDRLAVTAFKRIEAEHLFPVFVERCLQVVRHAIEDRSV
jgi:glycosyltransferase involved in cell wall biosynthesis